MWLRKFEPGSRRGARRSRRCAPRASGSWGRAVRKRRDGEFHPAHSDVNVAFVFSELGAGELEALRRVTPPGSGAGSSVRSSSRATRSCARWTRFLSSTCSSASGTRRSTARTCSPASRSSGARSGWRWSAPCARRSSGWGSPTSRSPARAPGRGTGRRAPARRSRPRRRDFCGSARGRCPPPAASWRPVAGRVRADAAALEALLTVRDTPRQGVEARALLHGASV